VELVLDLPVPSDPGGQRGGLRVPVAGDEVDDLDGLLALPGDGAADLRDLGGAGEPDTAGISLLFASTSSAVTTTRRRRRSCCAWTRNRRSRLIRGTILASATAGNSPLCPFLLLSRTGYLGPVS
jgi:hypothetical protein